MIENRPDLADIDACVDAQVLGHMLHRRFDFVTTSQIGDMIKAAYLQGRQDEIELQKQRDRNPGY